MEKTPRASPVARLNVLRAEEVLAIRAISRNPLDPAPWLALARLELLRWQIVLELSLRTPLE